MSLSGPERNQPGGTPVRKVHCPHTTQACEARLGSYPRQGIGWEAGKRQRVLGNRGGTFNSRRKTEEGEERYLRDPDGLSPGKLWLPPWPLTSLFIPECPCPSSATTLCPPQSTHPALALPLTM